MSKAQAGYIATGALVTSAIGGWAAGVLADRFGRARILQLTVLWFALFTFLSGFTHNFGELFLTRALQGFGFGGEWSVGSVLVAEIIDARHRGKSGSRRCVLGYFSSAAVAHDDTRHAVIDRNARRLLLHNDLVADLLGE